MSQQQR